MRLCVLYLSIQLYRQSKTKVLNGIAPPSTTQAYIYRMLPRKMRISLISNNLICTLMFSIQQTGSQYIARWLTLYWLFVAG